MGRRFNRWVPVLFAGLIAVVVGVAAYNLGFSHGLAQNWRPEAGGVPPWAWHRPWFGPGFFFFPFFFILFWIFVARALFWRGAWRRGYYRGGMGGGRCGDGGPTFDEWHRRAHERDRRDPPVMDF